MIYGAKEIGIVLFGLGGIYKSEKGTYSARTTGKGECDVSLELRNNGNLKAFPIQSLEDDGLARSIDENFRFEQYGYPGLISAMFDLVSDCETLGLDINCAKDNYGRKAIILSRNGDLLVSYVVYRREGYVITCRDDKYKYRDMLQDMESFFAKYELLPVYRWYKKCCSVLNVMDGDTIPITVDGSRYEVWLADEPTSPSQPDGIICIRNIDDSSEDARISRFIFYDLMLRSEADIKVKTDCSRDISTYVYYTVM